MAEPTAGIIQPNLHWTGGEDLSIQFADHMWVQVIGDTVVLTFGHTELPYVRQSDEERQRINAEGVMVKAVSRIVIGADKLEVFAEALNRVAAMRKRILQGEPITEPESQS